MLSNNSHLVEFHTPFKFYCCLSQGIKHTVMVECSKPMRQTHACNLRGFKCFALHLHIHSFELNMQVDIGLVVLTLYSYSPLNLDSWIFGFFRKVMDSKVTIDFILVCIKLL